MRTADLLYTTEKIGPKRERTPEGFLFCRDVPVARCGEMLYGPGETPVPVGPDGRTRISRDEGVVFDERSMASLVGKPVTLNHPSVDVDPANWRELACGVVMDARRGSGLLEDCLVADLLITDAEAIEAIERGLREVSCGYKPEYDADEDRPGYGWHRDIIYNHLALVPSGRCGPRCSIGDRQTQEALMRTTDKRGTFASMRDRVVAAFATKDERALSAALDEAEEEAEKEKAGDRRARDDDPDNPLSHHIEIHNHHPGAEDAMDAEPKWFTPFRKSVDSRFAAMDARLKARDEGEDDDKKKGEDELPEALKKNAEEKKEEAKDNTAILGQLEMEAPPGTGDRAKTAKDSAYLEDSWQDALAAAEVLVPGIRAPTFDRAADPKRSVNALCQFRRTTLDLAYNQADTRLLIDEANGGRALDTKCMTCDATRTLFNSVSAMKRAANNRTQLGGPGSHTADRGSGGGLGVRGRVRTLAELNELNSKRYASG